MLLQLQLQRLSLVVACCLVASVLFYARFNRQHQSQGRRLLLAHSQEQGEGEDDPILPLPPQRGHRDLLPQQQQQQQPGRSGGERSREGEGEGEGAGGDLSCQVGNEVQCIARIFECFGACIQSGPDCARCVVFAWEEEQRAAGGLGGDDGRGGEGGGDKISEQQRERERIWQRCCPCIPQILGPGWGWECPTSRPSLTHYAHSLIATPPKTLTTTVTADATDATTPTTRTTAKE